MPTFDKSNAKTRFIEYEVNLFTFSTHIHMHTYLRGRSRILVGGQGGANVMRSHKYGGHGFCKVHFMKIAINVLSSTHSADKSSKLVQSYGAHNLLERALFPPIPIPSPGSSPVPTY